MKIGFCAKMDRIGEVAEAGFDYIELPVSAAAAWSEEEFEQNLAKLKAAAVPAPAFNLLFPPTLDLLSSGIADEAITGYLRLALSRMQKLGGRVVVFGSGKSRRRPEGVSYDEAFRRLVEVTRLTGKVAESYGITVAIEPLNRNETNMINSLAEGACLRAAVNHPAVQLLGDYYHIAVEHQPPEDIVRIGGIRHCHIATEIGRRAPQKAEAGFRTMFAAMKQTGYDGLVSVEGKADDLSIEGPVSVSVLKKLWEEA